MNKYQDIENSDEFKYYEEHFDEIMDEMEKAADFKVNEYGETWDEEFSRIIDEVCEREARARRKRIIRKTLMAAAATVVVLLGTNYTLEIVQGDSLLDVIQSVISENGNQYVKYGTVDDVDITTEENRNEIFFETGTLDQTYQKIRDELKRPIIRPTYIPDGYKIIEAKYNMDYCLINMKLVDDEKYIYFSQQQQVDNASVGLVTDESLCDEVENKYINQTVSIYKSDQDNSMTFGIQVGQEVFTMRGTLSLDECKQIAESVTYE
jgi:hypothetical protein